MARLTPAYHSAAPSVTDEKYIVRSQRAIRELFADHVSLAWSYSQPETGSNHRRDSINSSGFGLGYKSNTRWIVSVAIAGIECAFQGFILRGIRPDGGHTKNILFRFGLDKFCKELNDNPPPVFAAMG
jgi:hypothetical protein